MIIPFVCYKFSNYKGKKTFSGLHSDGKTEVNIDFKIKGLKGSGTFTWKHVKVNVDLGVEINLVTLRYLRSLFPHLCNESKAKQEAREASLAQLDMHQCLGIDSPACHHIDIEQFQPISFYMLDQENARIFISLIIDGQRYCVTR